MSTDYYMDCKILNWMLKGTVEINDMFSYISKDMISDVLLYEYKFITKEILSYYSKHKIPPSYDVLSNIFEDDEATINLLETIKENGCQQNEIGFVVDNIKRRYNLYIIKRFNKLYDEGLESGFQDDELKDLNKEMKNILVKVDKLSKNNTFSEGKISESTEARIDNYNYVKNNPDASSGLLSGYKELDDYTWGIKKSEMLVIGGASSSGKSLLMMNMAINAWVGKNDPMSNEIHNEESGRNVVYVSCEMTKPQLEQRIDANLANITHKKLSRGLLDEYEMQKWEKSLSFQKRYKNIFYILDMPRGCSVAEIEAKFETLEAMFKPDAIFIDYLQLMAPNNGSTGSDWQDVGKVSEELHEFCRKKKLPVITAAQRKASTKKSSGKNYKDHIDLEDLGRSKMIGDNATVVMLISNREDENLKEDMEIHIVKNRDGAKGKVSLKKAFDKSRIESLPDGWSEDFGDENEI